MATRKFYFKTSCPAPLHPSLTNGLYNTKVFLHFEPVVLEISAFIRAVYPQWMLSVLKRTLLINDPSRLRTMAWKSSTLASVNIPEALQKSQSEFVTFQNSTLDSRRNIMYSDDLRIYNLMIVIINDTSTWMKIHNLMANQRLIKITKKQVYNLTISLY